MQTSDCRIFIHTLLSKIEFFLGIVIALIFFCATIYAIPTGFIIEEFPAFIFLLVMDAFAAFLIIHSRGNNKLLTNIKLYSAALASDPTSSIPNLAATMNTSEDVVRHNLQKMISQKYVTNMVISETSDYISFPNSEPVSSDDSADEVFKFKPGKDTEDTPMDSIEVCTVTCQGCGAVNTCPKGQITECEYCGSPIQA